MVTIYNRLSQPLCIGEEILSADGSMRLDQPTDDLKRLEALGHVSIVEDPVTGKATKAAVDDPTVIDKGDKK